MAEVSVSTTDINDLYVRGVIARNTDENSLEQIQALAVYKMDDAGNIRSN